MVILLHLLFCIMGVANGWLVVASRWPSTALMAASRRRIRPRRLTDSLEQRQVQEQDREDKYQQALQDTELLSGLSFDDFPISPLTRRALVEILGLTELTEIQQQIFVPARNGTSLLAQARTGTGKTLAYLVPCVELVVTSRNRPSAIFMVIVAPTRELVIQIAETVKCLTTFHRGITVQAVYGGTSMARDTNHMKRSLPTILVATPGRLMEHIQSTRLRGREFADALSQSSVLVLDEADRLVDSCTRELEKISAAMPRPEQRQTLMVSATVRDKARLLLENFLPASYVFVSGSSDPPPRLSQQYVVLPSLQYYVSGLVAILNHFREQKTGRKILVFFPAARLVKLFSILCSRSIGEPILEIHSRMSQASRRKASETFRSSKNAIMFSSDVSARGVDYPDVSLVVQYGSPSSAAGYVHRAGRVSRAGSKGKCLLVLLPFEKHKLRQVGQELAVCEDVDLSANDGMRLQAGDDALSTAAEAAILSFLAYYRAHTSLRTADILDEANAFADSIGASIPPLPDDLRRALKL